MFKTLNRLNVAAMVTFLALSSTSFAGSWQNNLSIGGSTGFTSIRLILSHQLAMVAHYFWYFMAVHNPSTHISQLISNQQLSSTE